MSFKVCTSCKCKWFNRDMFLSDPKVQVIGYQANIEKPEKGVFLFNHVLSGCETTLAIETGQFTDMYAGPVFVERLAGQEDKCPGFCLYESELEPCPAKCNCAYVRDVLQKVRDWPKKSSACGNGKQTGS